MKKVIGISIFLVVLGIIIYLLNGSLPQTQQISVSQKQNATQSNSENIEKDAQKWGNSPFSSGSTSTIDPTELPPKISQPNTIWQTQSHQINGENVTYVFGQGQPLEVAIPKEKIVQYMETVNPETGEGPHGYITPQAENALKEFLDNPSLPYFIEKCYQEIDWYSVRPGLQEWERYPQELDMVDMMYVDARNGLKEFNHQSISTMLGVFNQLDNPLASSEEKGWKKCLSPSEYQQHFIPLHQELSETYRIYSSPAEFLQ